MTCLKSYIKVVGEFTPRSPSHQTPRPPGSFHSIRLLILLYNVFIPQTIPQSTFFQKKTNPVLLLFLITVLAFYCYITNYHKMKLSDILGSYSSGRNAYHFCILGEIMIQVKYAANRIAQNGIVSVAWILQSHHAIKVSFYWLQIYTGIKVTVEIFNPKFKRQILIINSLCQGFSHEVVRRTN